MSAPMAVNDVITITYFGELAGQTIETVLHARLSTALTGGTTAELQLVDLAGKVATGLGMPFLAQYLNSTSEDLIITHVRVQKIAPVRTIYAQQNIGVSGSILEPAAPPNIAASIEKQSTFVGRKGVGRMQLCGVPISQIVDGELEAGYITTNLDPLANSLIGSFTGGALYAGVWSWCLPAATTPNPALDVFNAFAYRNVRTMHRRTVGLGI